MNKAEILEKARKENKGQDFAEMEVIKKTMFFGWITVVTLSCFFAIADGIIFSRFPFEMLSAVTSGLSVLFLLKYKSLKRRHELMIGIAYGVAAIAFFVLWIISAIIA